MAPTPTMAPTPKPTAAPTPAPKPTPNPAPNPAQRYFDWLVAFINWLMQMFSRFRW